MPRNQDVIAIYSRKSRFTGKGDSIGNQVELCREYIRTAFGEACAAEAVVFEDEGFSGGNLNRPDFRKMMQAAREHRFRAVVVYRLDRISRNISDFSTLIEELGRLSIDFISIRESFDTSSPMGRAMMYIASVFSQLERETIAERIRDNMHELAKTGRWLGGTTPTGYASEAVRTVTVDGKSRRSCKLCLLPEEADIVREIYDLYRETDSLTGTEAELLRRHRKTKNGRNFTRFSIKGILQNPVYLIADRESYRYFAEKQADLFSAPEEFDGIRGILAYNRTDQRRGHTTIYRPISEWIVSVGQHPGLIPSGTWICVQQSLERNKGKGYRKPRRNQALLTGLLWCSCGSRMYPKLSGRVTKEGRQIYGYLCKMKERSRRDLCNRRNADGNRLDAAVLAQVACLPEAGDYFLTCLEKGKRMYAGRRRDTCRQLEELRQQQAENRRKLGALVDLLADLTGSDAAFPVKERIEALQAQEQGLQARICEWEGQTARQPLHDAEFERLSREFTVFRDCIGRMTVSQERAVLRALVCRVVWDGRCARVVLLGAQEKTGPRRVSDETPWGEDSK